MTDNADFAAGGAMAAMNLHFALFKVLIKRGILAPEQVREVIDAVTLTMEMQAGATDNAQTKRALTLAQAQASNLLEALEATTPEMLVSRRES